MKITERIAAWLIRQPLFVRVMRWRCVDLVRYWLKPTDQDRAQMVIIDAVFQLDATGRRHMIELLQSLDDLEKQS